MVVTWSWWSVPMLSTRFFMSSSSGSRPSLNLPRKTPKLAQRLQRPKQTRQRLCVTLQKVDLWQLAIKERLKVVEDNCRPSVWSVDSMQGSPKLVLQKSLKKKFTTKKPTLVRLSSVLSQAAAQYSALSGKDAKWNCSYVLAWQSRQCQAKRGDVMLTAICLEDH